MSTKAAEMAGIAGVDAGAIPYPKQHPMLIYLSGLAGTGKTQIAHGLEYALRREGIQVQYQWLSGGNSTLAEIVVRLCRFQPEDALRLRQPPGLGKDLHFWSRKVSWYLLVALDLLQFCVFRVRLPLLLGKVVICDGTPFDTFNDIAHRCERDPASSQMNAFERLFHFLYPEPDLHYLLLGSSEEMDRPDETLHLSSEADLPAQCRLYLTRYRTHARFLVKRPDGDFDRLKREIVRESVKKYWEMAQPGKGAGRE